MLQQGNLGAAAAAAPADEAALASRRALTLLVGADCHGSQSGFDWFCQQAEELRPAGVVFLGDFVTGQPLSFVRDCLLTLRELAPRALVVPGNWDPREALVEFDRHAQDGLRNLHKAGAYIGGYSFAGLGGSIRTPAGTTPFEGEDDDPFTAPLSVLLPVDVWVLHQPLYGFRDSPRPEQHVGSQGLRRLWEAQAAPPLLVLSGHIHEAGGVEQAGRSVFVNPGPLLPKDGLGPSCALVELAGDSVRVEHYRGALPG